MAVEVVVTCFHCQTKNVYIDRVGFRDECSQCGEDAHCCRNCKFYDSKAYNECRETSAEVVREKNRSNRCDFFQANGLVSSEKSSRDSLLDAAEALFKKS